MTQPEAKTPREPATLATPRPPTTYRLVEHLVRAMARGDGTTLGALRRGWSQPLALYPIIAPFLPIPPSRLAEDIALLIGRLLGEHPTLGSVPFAVGLQRAAGKGSAAASEARMTRIMASPFEDLPSHLRRAVARLRAEGIAIDWHRLMDDLHRWDAPGQPVQRAWARAYWGVSDRPDATDDSSEETEPTTPSTLPSTPPKEAT